MGLIAAACGDDQSRQTSTTAGQATTTTGAEATTTLAAEELSCDSLLSLDDVAALFGEPAVFDAEQSEDVAGRDEIACVWTSIESPDDLEDLQSQLFQIQVYRGEDFYAPEFYEDPEPIAGIGDDAFVSPQLGVSTAYIEGDRVVLLTFSVIGAGDAPDSITKKDQVVDLLRLVHDRLA